MPMSFRWIVETDATIDVAEQITLQRGWMQGGRLGAELVTDHGTALQAANHLLTADCGVRLSPETTTGVREACEDGLELVREAAAGMLGWIHGALHSGMTPAEIAKHAGMPTTEMELLISRYDLADWVEGEHSS